jgi:hypothetical protein
MAETRKVLGQAFPAAATLVPLYTVPAATQAVKSTLTVCETAGVATTYRWSVAVNGAADTFAQYISYDSPLLANETKAFTLGATLGTGDVIRVRSASGLVAFNAFGVELT